MAFVVEKPGLFTIVQDLGRWGGLSRGVSLSGPMDRFSLLMGNVMLGNDPNDAALEMAFLGPDVVFLDERCLVLVGAEFDARIDGELFGAWTVRRIAPGGRLSIGGTRRGCRAYLCISGGIDVPLVMGSRSTHVRAKLGGYSGRAILAGDVVELGAPRPLWRAAEGFVCPEALRLSRSPDEPIDAMDGPQVDAFTEKGIKTFYGSAYVVTDRSDRMGCRLDGSALEHMGGPDGANIISEAVVHGAVQVPGDGKPIVLMSDCQTVGGYSKIAVVSSWSVAALAQRAPGSEVRFRRVTTEDAVWRLKKFEMDLWSVAELRATHRSRPSLPAF
ncbi:MAG: biotin-dependent carboxyltransferase family protein [Synergistaceae bacterium]|jgi:biotin-dependent carboxylase-like uncharacterized protein|nr:biotin-dependent carboxyltransferase family protein [Synergistaceae bacterium]